jgi:hypothetical protein
MRRRGCLGENWRPCRTLALERREWAGEVLWRVDTLKAEKLLNWPKNLVKNIYILFDLLFVKLKEENLVKKLGEKRAKIIENFWELKGGEN